MTHKTILILAFISICLFGHSQTKKALFLGNSYTFYNNLPGLVDSIAQSHGDTLLFDVNTPGGYSLEGHSTNATSIVKIQEGGWDFVVLQEQSQLPAFPIEQVEEDVFPYAEILVEEIRAYNDCAMPLFYMTWGRENGDTNNCESWPPVCTYDGMQDLLTERYSQMGFANQAYIGPVGEAWRLTRETYPEIQLYASDGSHPSYAGSYLAACVFYGSMWGENAQESDFYGELDLETAIQLQEMADLAVFGGEDWNFYDLLSYDLTLTEGDVMHFLDGELSPYITQLEITIEGVTYVLPNDEEIIFYVSDINSIVEIVVTSPCGTTTVNVILGDLITNVSELKKEVNFNLFPNPTLDTLTLSSDVIMEEAEIWDSHGKLVLSQIIQARSVEISVSNLDSGVYYLSVDGQEKRAFVIL